MEIVNDYGSRLSIVPCRSVDVHRMSFGKVDSKEDLYSPAIFGPAQDNACVCGKYKGEEHAGLICHKCGVKVDGNSAALRSMRCGHVSLSIPCKHPLSDEVSMEAFPVAPINLRVSGEEGSTLTRLGLKYEELIDYNNLIRKSLPDKSDDSYYHALINMPEESRHLQELLKEIVGNKSVDAADGFDKDSILGIMNLNLLVADKDVPLYFHLMGMRFYYQGIL
jgi:hypothetical protein